MKPFAVVIMLPEPEDETRVDFAGREFASWPEFAAAAMEELEARIPDWRVVAVCHVEDLPLHEESPPGWTG